jgi:hypothetical protein
MILVNLENRGKLENLFVDCGIWESHRGLGNLVGKQIMFLNCMVI